MHLDLNPYTPGSGRRPPALTGRQPIIDGFDLVVARSKQGHTDRGLMLSGLRGVGKTALLNYLRMVVAEPADWVTISLEASATRSGAASVRHQLGRELLSAVRRFSRRRRAAHVLADLQEVIGSFTVSVGPVSLSRDAPATNSDRAGTGTLEIDLPELIEDVCTLLQAERSALAIFIDEMQDLDSELLSALVSVQHMANQRELPFFLIGAGLPNLPAVLASARSYAERLFTYATIGPLSPADAAEALREPVQRLGADYTTEALSQVVDVSQGYPYFLQTFGACIWNLAPATPFTLTDAQLAITEGWQQMDAGFFPSRWERATPTERAYLHAMATLTTPAHPAAPGAGTAHVATGDIAAALGASQKATSVARGQLIDKGLIYSPEYGHVAFTVPGMAQYLTRQDPTITPGR